MSKVYLFHPLKTVKAFVSSIEGRSFKVWFMKSDGNIRKMRCHVDLNYKPKPRKDGKPNKKLPPTSIFVFDEKKEEYRSFKADSVVYIYSIGSK